MLVAFGKGDNISSCVRHKRDLYDSNMHVWSGRNLLNLTLMRKAYLGFIEY